MLVLIALLGLAKWLHAKRIWICLESWIHLHHWVLLRWHHWVLLHWHHWICLHWHHRICLHCVILRRHWLVSHVSHHRVCRLIWSWLWLHWHTCHNFIQLTNWVSSFWLLLNLWLWLTLLHRILLFLLSFSWRREKESSKLNFLGCLILIYFIRN